MPVANYRAPKKLSPGATVAIVAPSSPFPKEEFERGVARLGDRYEVRVSSEIFSTEGYLAGNDERRLAELVRAVEDPEVDGIIAARGGYGATRLLDRLDASLVKAHPKALVGFSDVTALHALWQRAGLRSLHAHMVAALGRAPDELVPRYFAALEGAHPTNLTDLETVREGVARGPLLGGNLAVLGALAATPYAPPLDGAILFIEDVGERPYRIDRVLTTLAQAGWFERVVGVAVGCFTECNAGEDGWGAEDVLRERLGRLEKPVVLGVPAGHQTDNLELPLGAPATLDADAASLTIHEGAFA